MAPADVTPVTSGWSTSRTGYSLQVLVPIACLVCGYAIAAAMNRTSAPGTHPVQWSPPHSHNSSEQIYQSRQAVEQLLQVQQQIQQEVQKLEGLRSQLQKDQQAIASQAQLLKEAKLSDVQQQLQEQVQMMKQLKDDEAERLEVMDADNAQLLENIRESEKQLLQHIRDDKQHLLQQLQQQQGFASNVDMHDLLQSRNGTQGVICTVLKNEAKYVAEWIAFHLVVGATKFVIYDDNSTDNLLEAVKPFGDAVDVINMYKDVQGVPGDAGIHRVAGRQDWAFDHCKKNYGLADATGWFGIWDIDEFVYPCRRPGTSLHGNILWDAWKSSTIEGASGHQLRCSIFGVNAEDTPQPPGQLVLTNNIRRAADGLTEPVAAPQAWNAVREGCDKCGCCQDAGVKTMYNISKVSGLRLWTHGTHTAEAVIDQSWQKPHGGLCCNHYQFKSTEEALAKSEANLNKHYEKVGTTADAKKYLTLVQDTLIWQYLPDMLGLMQSRGIQVDIPAAKQRLSTEGNTV